MALVAGITVALHALEVLWLAVFLPALVGRWADGVTERAGRAARD